MTEAEKTEINTTSRKMLDILFTANESLKIVRYLLDAEDRFLKKSNIFFNWSVIVNWRLAVTELNKLVINSRNQHYNLERLFKYIENSGSASSTLLHQIATFRIQILLHKTTIGKLQEQRDRVYAHTDIGSDIIKNDVNITDVHNIIVLIIGILNYIRVELGENHFTLDVATPPIDGLVQLIRMRKERDDYLRGLEEGLSQH